MMHLVSLFCLFLFLLLKRLHFSRVIVGLPKKLRKRHRDFQHTTCLQTRVASPIINISHQRGTFANKDKPTLT